ARLCRTLQRPNRPLCAPRAESKFGRATIMGNPMTAGADGIVAELGPLLGRVIAPPEAKTPVDAALEEVRLELLTELFERRAALDGPTWLSLWESAVERAAQVLLAELERQLLD